MWQENTTEMFPEEKQYAKRDQPKRFVGLRQVGSIMIIFINSLKIKFIALVVCVVQKHETRVREIKKNYHRAINYKGSDMRKMISMDDQMEEFTGQKIHRKTKSW